MKVDKRESKGVAIKDPSALKKWILKKIVDISDADPVTLVPYILVLLKKSASINDMKASCVAQLDVFLKSHTEAFVNELFHCIETEEYLHQEEYSPVNSIPYSMEQTHYPAVHQAPVTSSLSDNILVSHLSQEQSYRTGNAADGGANKSITTSHYREREKELKLQSSHSRSHRGRGKSASSSSSSRSRSRSPEVASTVTVADSAALHRKIHSREYSRGDGKADHRSENTYRGGNGGYRKRFLRRCRDYDLRGFCLKGDKCTFSHGTDALVMPSVGVASSLSAAWQLLTSASAASKGNATTYPIPPPPLGINGTHSQEYNVGPPPVLPEWSLPVYHPSPVNRTSANTNLISVVSSPAPNSPQQSVVPPGYEPTFSEPLQDPSASEPTPVRDSSMGISSSDLRAQRMFSSHRRFSPNNSSRNRYQPYSSQRRGRPFGHFHDDQGFRGGGGRSRHPQHCIRVNNIPAGKDNVGDIHACFKEFGNIIKVEMLHNQPHSALVFYSNEHEVERAYRHTGIFLGSPLVEVKLNQSRFGNQFKRFDNFQNEDRQDSVSGGEDGMDGDDHQKHRENKHASFQLQFSRERKISDSSRGSKSAIGHHVLEDRRRMEKDLALKERQEQIALLDKAKEDHQRFLVTSLTSLIQKLLDKHDSVIVTDSATEAHKKQLYECLMQSSRFLEQIDDGQCSTEELFKHIPEQMKKITQRFGITLNKPPSHVVALESYPTATAAMEKKTLLKLDTRPSVVFVTGFQDEKAEEEANGFCSLLAHSNMPIADHRLCEVESGQIVLAVKFVTREDAEKAVRGIKRYRGKDVTLSFTPPLGLQANLFQNDSKPTNTVPLSQDSADSKDESSADAHLPYRRNNSLSEHVTMVVDLSEDENMAEFDNEDDSI